MKNSTQLLSIILILALSCLIQFTNAQIVYTDVNPDNFNGCNSSCGAGFACTETYNIDLNQDGQDDFILTTHSGPGITFPITFPCNASVRVTGLDGNEISCINTTQPLAIDAGSEIFGGAWSSWGTLRSVFAGAFGGLWTASGDKYLGVRLQIGGNYYYGWIRLNISVTNSVNAQCTTRDFAYNSIADSSILAGETCPPQAKISPSGPISFCLGDSAILTSVNSGTNLSYHWKLNNANIPAATNKSYTTKIAGKYKVKVTDNTNGCTATSAVVKVKVPCKVLNEDLNLEDYNLVIYPNPLLEYTTISFSASQSENISLKIFDLQGILIRTLANDVMSAGTHELTWDARDENRNAVSAGIYFLRMQTADVSQSIQLSVIR